MGVRLTLENFDDLLFRRATKQPIIINDLSDGSEEDREKLKQLTYTTYNTDLLSNLPSCQCGELIGEHLVGVECPECHYVVAAPLDQELEPLVWMRAPNGVEALINPIVWTMLAEKFTRSGFEIVRWLCDTTYKPQVKMPAVMEAVQELNIPRGYNNFVKNFDSIIEKLFNLKEFRPKKTATGFAQEVKNARGVGAKFTAAKDYLFKSSLDPLQELLQRQRDCVFSKYLPLPNRSLLVIEETNVGTYVDPIITGAVDAILTIASIDSPLANHSVRTKENRTIKTIAQLAEFYDGVYRSTLAKKEGIFRKHVYGTRSHFSFRAVISSLTARHQYDELHIPWGIGISLFRPHLQNKLMRRHGYNPNQSIAFLNAHAQRHHPLLEQLFQELIDECPYKGIPVVFQRNPSLERGSAQAMFVTQVKTRTDIPTVSLSILSVKGFNADRSYCYVFIIDDPVLAR
jgi:hypothetical protein